MLRVRTILTGWPGAPGLNTFYFDPDVVGPATVAEEAHVRVREFWEDIASLFPNEFTATVDQVVDEVDSTTGDLIGSHAVTTSNVVAGTNTTGDFLPAQTQAVLSMRTGDTINGRRVRGRSYIGPMFVGANGSTGQMMPAALAQLAGAGIALLVPPPSGGFLVVWHRPSNEFGNDGQACAVIDTLVRPIWGHLKSRRT